MAYSYYSVKEWQPAIEKFKQLSSTEDSLGQTAMYLLGDSYLRTGDKRSARNAFGIASGMDFNKGQQEAALLLHAKLSYELGYNDDAVRSLTQLILDYPRSQSQGEAKTLLSSLLLKTRNYSGAYDLLSQVSERDAAWWRVHQKATYGLATKYLQDDNLSAADSLFRRSRVQATDAEYDAAASFWLGEINMRRNNYGAAIENLRAFATYAEPKGDKDIAGSGANMNSALFNLGYASMELERYDDAKSYFARIKSASARPGISALAKVREGDALFMLKDYKAALASYEQVIASGEGGETDYAALQRAVVLGALGRKNEKIAQLNSLIKKEDSSRYGNMARYELGLTLIEDDKYQQAITALAPVVADVPGPLTQKALIRTAFARQQLNDDPKAIESYRKAIIGYPASDERTAALEALKAIYIERNEPQAFDALLKEIQVQGTENASSENTYYAAAETQFAAGRWAAAKQGFDQYLKTYPQGASALSAHYYKGETHYQLKEPKDALLEYDAVLAQPWNQFSEPAARRAAGIAEKDSNYAAAIGYYTALRNNAMTREGLQQAYNGLLKAAYNKQDFPLAQLYADSLMSLPDVDSQARREVQFFRGRSLQLQGKYEDALAAYKSIKGLRSGAVQAELGYRIAEVQLAMDKLQDAEASAAANLKTAAGNEYWVVKSYLLIADILVKQKDYFNAKATLQSVISNTKNAALKNEAKEKLAEVKKTEKNSSKLSEE